MTYVLKCWPESVYRKEVLELPADLSAQVGQVLLRLRAEGPKPMGYSNCKNLGKDLGGMWQLGFKTERREQIRLLYYVSGAAIVLLTVFKKTSEPIEQRAYELAMKRKRQAEQQDDISSVH